MPVGAAGRSRSGLPAPEFKHGTPPPPSRPSFAKPAPLPSGFVLRLLAPASAAARRHSPDPGSLPRLSSAATKPGANALVAETGGIARVRQFPGRSGMARAVAQALRPHPRAYGSRKRLCSPAAFSRHRFVLSPVEEKAALVSERAVLRDETSSPVAIALAEEVGHPRARLSSQPRHAGPCQQGRWKREKGKGKGGSAGSLSGLWGSCVERCTSWVLFCRSCTVSSAHAACTRAQQAVRGEGRDGKGREGMGREGKARQGKVKRWQLSLCWLRGSDTHSAHRVRSVTVPPPTQRLSQPAAVGAGLVPHHRRGAP